MTEISTEADVTSHEVMDVDSPSDLIISASTTELISDVVKTEYEEAVETIDEEAIKMEDEEAENEVTQTSVENGSPSSEQ